MYRGTTPTFIFKVETELDLNDMQQIWVTIRDSRGFLHSYDIAHVTIDDSSKEISLFLSQQETFRIMKGKAQAQIRFLTNDNIALATETVNITIENTLKGGII